MKRILTLSFITLAIVGIVLVLLRNKSKLEEREVAVDRSVIPVSVATYEVKPLAIKKSFEVPATLTAIEEATVVAETAGRIERLSFSLGSKVQKGQTIGRIDVREKEIKLQAAQLNIDHLRREYERNKILAEGNAINTKTLQDSKYDYDSKMLEAEELLEQIADANIVAPVGGIITEKSKEPGEFVAASTTIAHVVNICSLKAQVYVPEKKVFRLKPGQVATITTEVFPSQTFSGKITFISPQGDQNHNYMVELSIDNKTKAQLRAGMYAVIGFNDADQSPTLQIPKSALVNGLKDPYVYAVKGDRVVELKLVLGDEAGEHVEVIRGLSEGDLVVSRGQINLTNGSLVKIMASK